MSVIESAVGARPGYVAVLATVHIAPGFAIAGRELTAFHSAQKDIDPTQIEARFDAEGQSLFLKYSVSQM